MRRFGAARNTKVSEDKPPLTQDDQDKQRGKLLLTLGSLAKYFTSPIGFFEDLMPGELDEWIEVMNEMVRMEEDAFRKAQNKGK